MKHPLPLAPLALLVAGCIAQEPTGPPIAILTVSTAQPLDVAAVAPDVEAVATAPRDGRGDFELLAASFGAAPELIAAGPFPVLPGAATTLAERATAAGFEAAAFTSGASAREESGLLQGHLHGEDEPLLASRLAAGEASPARLARTATDGARAFVEQKLPRPMEDASYVWLHLDLTAVDAPEAERLVRDAWSALDGAHGDREALRVLWLLPTAAGGGSLAATGGRPAQDATLYDLVAERAALPPLAARAAGDEVCTTHYPPGELWAVRRYTAGAPDHPWIVWYPSEAPKHEYVFDAGARTGTWRTRFPSGALAFERGYDADEPDGPWQRWWADGSTAAEGTFEAGRRVGTWREWHPNGQLALEAEFEAGAPAAIRRWDAQGEALPAQR